MELIFWIEINKQALHQLAVSRYSMNLVILR